MDSSPAGKLSKHLCLFLNSFRARNMSDTSESNKKRRFTTTERARNETGRGLVVAVMQKQPETVDLLLKHLRGMGYELASGFGTDADDGIQTACQWVDQKYRCIRDLPCATLITNILQPLSPQTLLAAKLEQLKKEA